MSDNPVIPARHPGDRTPMPSRPRPNLRRRFIIWLLIFAFSTMAGSAWLLYRYDNVNLSTIGGSTIAGHSSQLQMQATLPPKLDNSYVVPVVSIGNDRVGNQLIYGGEQPLSWNHFGNEVTFEIDTVGVPGDTMIVALLRVDYEQMLWLRSLNLDADERETVYDELNGAGIIDTFTMTVEGA